MKLINDQIEIEKIFSDINHDDLPFWNDHPLFGELFRHSEPFARINGREYLPCHIALVAATLREREINHYGFPTRIALRRGLTKKEVNNALGIIIEGLRAAAGRDGATALILGGEWGAPLSEIDNEMIKRMARPSMRIHATSDLSSGSVQIRKHIRKSYRSLINWGKQNLQMRYVSANDQKFDLFETFPDFHRQIAGKQHYGPAFWNTLWSFITQGTAELSLAYHEQNQLVGCVYVADAGKTTYYSMGVFNRNLFNSPLSHFPVFDAMVRASSRGMKIFDLGEIPVKNDGINDKEVQIGFFKRGFASNYNRFTLWELEL